MTSNNKKLVKLLNILQEESTSSMSNETFTIEQPRHSKFSNVQTMRDNCGNNRAEITACQPEMYLSIMQNSSCMPEISLRSSLRRSLAKINLIQPSHQSNSCLNINEGDSIVSTAEEHLTNQLNIKNAEMKFKPKSTSSTTSLFNLVRRQASKRTKKDDSTVTFNVDFASTPKKNLPRSSTPRVNKRKQFVQPFSSTVISEQSPKVCNSLAKKSIPPPLLSSSSYQPSVKIAKRARSSSCKQCSLKPKRLSTKKQRKSAMNVVASQISQPNYFKNFKFPIKYLPNKKSKDIDRLSSVDDRHLGSYECEMKPVLKSCYSFGDYNVWIL